MDRYDRYPRRILCRVGRLQALRPRLLRFGRRSGRGEHARKKSVLNVNGLVVRPQSLADGITMVGNLLPDEEVDLSFETSGKIVEINFKEGSIVRKGELLAKVNDKPLLAQLSRYEAQLKLAEDRVYRQSALLEKDAVSQEAYEQASTGWRCSTPISTSSRPISR